MSSVDVNDENRGVCPGGKHNSSSNDIFALDQPTGRPSILRQTENLPSKTVPKGIKVCFQTPRRDPVTKRIVSPNKSVRMSSVDECAKAMEFLNLDKSNTLPQEATEQPEQELSSYPDDNMPIRSKGGYQLDFYNLDAINPFGGSDKMALSPVRPPTEQIESQQHTTPENITEEPTEVDAALDETLPFIPSVENSLVNISSTDSSVVTVAKVSEVEEDSCTATPDEKQPDEMSLSTDQDKAAGGFSEDAPLPTKGSYNFDFDNLDAINPFQTGGSKIQNSPELGRKVSNNAEENKPETVDVPEEAQELLGQLEVKPTAAVAPLSANTDKPPAAESQPAEGPVKEEPLRLEFNFDDGSEVKKKPRPKKFDKRPPGLKPKEGKLASDVKPPKEAPVKPDAAEVADVPKSSYSFDFEKFDDPNFNPFGTKTDISNSPQSSKKFSPMLMETATAEQTDNPVETEAASPVCTEESFPTAELDPAVIAEDKVSADHDKGLESERVQSLPEFFELCQPDQTSQTGLVDGNEDFVPGTLFMANDFEGQMDYLEQFGSSNFKESALRKQSLYLKFDPLMRESPKKSAGPSAQIHIPGTAPFVSRLETPQMVAKEATDGPQKDGFRLLDGAPAPTPILEILVPPFHQPAEDAIIEVLKYSQKDMDAAIAKVQAEAKEKDEQWSAKYQKLLDDDEEMRKMIAQFEPMIANMMADQEREREAAKAKLNEVLLEKEQVSNDLNAMERSFSDLFKRLDKYKDIVEGYKKNEETLKGCAQGYLERIKKEEQRYQTLKAHAEEKISHANAEIAEVRSKNRAEGSALHVQLRREQLKVQSLEKSLSQKEKEVEELTKLCDELISNVKKG